MVRTVEEWIGKTDDSMPSEGCKRRVVARQGNRCAISGIELVDGVKVEFDHVVPLWLGGENRESNLQAVTAKAHKAKTATEATVRAKVNRNQLKRMSKKPSSLTHQRFKRLMDGSVIDRRTGELVNSRSETQS